MTTRIDKFALISNVTAIRKANSLLFKYRRNRWRWSARFRDPGNVTIDRPIFLIGTQGGGLTLLSRILQRHGQVVSSTGNPRRWGGDDEAQNVYDGLLPEDAGWRRIQMEQYPVKDLGDWVYASDAVLPYYRRKAEDFDPHVAAHYRDTLRRIIALNRITTQTTPRFLDKSQSVTVRVGLFHRMLKGSNPKFVLMSRNPYAVVWRAAKAGHQLLELDASIEERLEIAAQHWANSFTAALADKDADDGIALRVFSFEEMLRDVSGVMRQICDFAELPYAASILPSPDDSIPWGAAFDAFNRRKWYPLRPEVNDRYLAELPSWACERIHAICGPVAERLGYCKPRTTGSQSYE